MYSCMYCDYEDTLSMVQCDDCHGWAHFECAGVDESIEHFPWSCLTCLEEAIKEREKQLEKKEDEVKKREEEIERKENEVDQIIEEAKNSIKYEFEIKTAVISAMELDAKKKLEELERRENEIKLSECALTEKLSRTKEQEANVLVENGAGIETGTESNGNSYLDCLPISETDFTAWDASIKTKKNEMIQFYLDINYKEEYTFLKQCIEATFTEEHILKINFEKGSPISTSNFLRL